LSAQDRTPARNSNGSARRDGDYLPETCGHTVALHGVFRERRR
jgi:hypothetical protein